MRAVNLIPGDQRSGAPVGAGRSEGAAYAVLALLAIFAVLAVLYGKASRDVTSSRAKSATLTAEAQRAQTEASSLAPYTAFVALRQQRAAAVSSLVDTRFDWAHAFHEFGRVLSGQTSISSLSGTIGTTAATLSSSSSTPSSPSPAAGSSSSTSSSTASTPSSAPVAPASAGAASATPAGSVPTFTLSGCATSQRAVAQMLPRLRLIDGVSGVTLQSSTRSNSSGAGGSGGCPGRDPVFAVGVTFSPLPSASSAAAAATAKVKTVAATGTAAQGGKTG